MSKLTGEALQKELQAQRKRAKALSYLEKNGCGPGRVENALNTRGATEAIRENRNQQSTTDNTLDLLLNQRVNNSLGSKESESAARKNIIQQQEIFRQSQDGSKTTKEEEKLIEKRPLPPNWVAVIDESSGDTYFWNTTTKETTWERPHNSQSSHNISDITENIAENNLPPGWVEAVHSATGQKYYIHQATGEKSWTKPVEGAVVKSTNDTKNTSDDAKRKLKYTEAQEKEKRRRLLIDPLDPTGGLGKWSDGMGKDGKMADSTASGPLWQQRPYPAPGMALKGKEKAKESNIGPSRPG